MQVWHAQMVETQYLHVDGLNDLFNLTVGNSLGNLKF